MSVTKTYLPSTIDSGTALRLEAFKKKIVHFSRSKLVDIALLQMLDKYEGVPIDDVLKQFFNEA